MSEPILHDFDWSPYAEKVRVLLAIKGLAWRSVQVAAWEQRVRAVGHGRRSDIEAGEALEVARAAAPTTGAGVAVDDPSRLQVGQRVTVTPDDYGEVAVA
ncbi:MAG TPA: glutathione S-transferase N-terminal domain-containing protein [Steroidobacteraceae bacterium]